MTNSKCQVVRSQAGFTLVELAIVMIIIGLLIGGVLKGQELIGNARVTSTIAQIKAIDAATSTFKDMYAALPGDVRGPGNRLPNCTADNCTASGNGNGIIDAGFNAAPTGEAATFFVHLSAADLLSGLNPAGDGGAWNSLYPAATVSGGYHVGGVRAAAELTGAVATVGARSGTYLVLTQTAGAAPAATLTPNQAFRIDAKLDDGVPGTGSTRSNGGGEGGGGCASATAYNESVPDAACFLYTRIQG